MTWQMGMMKKEREPWTYHVSGHLKYIIKWFISFLRFNRRPGILDIIHERFQIMPEFATTYEEGAERRESMRFSLSPDWRMKTVTSRTSGESVATQEPMLQDAKT